jgi:hypothetical protein
MTSIITADTPTNLNVQTGGVPVSMKLVAFVEPDDETAFHKYPHDSGWSEFRTSRTPPASLAYNENFSLSPADRAGQTADEIFTRSFVQKVDNRSSQ